MEEYKLIMEDEKCILNIEMIEPIFDAPDRAVEISYYQYGSEGWGAGGDEYIYDHDIQAIANGIRNIMQYRSGDFVYSCGIVEQFYKELQKPILIIELHKHPENETYDFTVSLIETLERLSYVTVSKTGLTAQSFQEYADIIFMWEKQFCGKGETHGQL